MKLKSHYLSSFLACAVMFAGLSPVVVNATEQAQQRQDARDTRQDSRQDSRDAKQTCKDDNTKSNQDCRQDKHQSKQDGRQGARDIKY